MKKNGKYCNSKKGLNMKPLALLLALTLLVGCAIGGTIAWLTDTTQEVENTFTVGNINIELAESENLNLKMIPGNEITKDPKVTVKAGSEECWVFVKLDKEGSATVGNDAYNFDSFITYAIAAGWTQLTKDKDGNTITDLVYYREQTAIPENGADAVYSVLLNDKVQVNSTVTKAMMDALKTNGAVQPKLSFQAFAIQKASFDTAAKAWAEINP